MIIKAKITPNSKEEKIEKISENEYKIKVKEPAEDNKANTRLINILAKEFGVNYKSISIKNPASRDKMIEIEK